MNKLRGKYCVTPLFVLIVLENFKFSIEKLVIRESLKGWAFCPQYINRRQSLGALAM